MATYQEQLEAARLRRAKAYDAERKFDQMCGAIALLPYIEAKTLTEDQAADLMVKVVKAVLSIEEEQKPKWSARP